MDNTRALYLMLSRTNTAMGKTIRFFTNYEYNHVSLSLDPELRQWVSFARYVKDVPLAGGFVAESPERLLDGGTPLPVRIFRISISERRFLDLEKLFALAGQADSGLIYNTFGALASTLGVHCHIAGAYTCLEFANEVLGERHLTIAELDRDHSNELIFEGDLQELAADNGCREGLYFVPCGFFHAVSNTAGHFGRLFCRAILSRHQEDAVAAIRS